MKNVTIYEIGCKQQAVRGDYIEFRSCSMTDLLNVRNSYDLVKPLEYEVKTSLVHEYRTPQGDSSYFCYHPEVAETFGSPEYFMSRITDLESKNYTLKSDLYHVQTDLRKLKQAKWYTRLKWVFTGINS